MAKRASGNPPIFDFLQNRTFPPRHPKCGLSEDDYHTFLDQLSCIKMGMESFGSSPEETIDTLNDHKQVLSITLQHTSSSGLISKQKFGQMNDCLLDLEDGINRLDVSNSKPEEQNAMKMILDAVKAMFHCVIAKDKGTPAVICFPTVQGLALSEAYAIRDIGTTPVQPQAAPDYDAPPIPAPKRRLPQPPRGPPPPLPSRPTSEPPRGPPPPLPSRPTSAPEYHSSSEDDYAEIDDIAPAQPRKKISPTRDDFLDGPDEDEAPYQGLPRMAGGPITGMRNLSLNSPPRSKSPSRRTPDLSFEDNFVEYPDPADDYEDMNQVNQDSVYADMNQVAAERWGSSSRGSPRAPDLSFEDSFVEYPGTDSEKGPFNLAPFKDQAR